MGLEPNYLQSITNTLVNDNMDKHLTLVIREKKSKVARRNNTHNLYHLTTNRDGERFLEESFHCDEN